jgi:hypothetical protein
MTNDNWTGVYTTQFEHQAEIVKAVLESNDIPSVIINKKDSAYHFGELEVFVNADNVLRANQIIKREEL